MGVLVSSHGVYIIGKQIKHLEPYTKSYNVSPWFPLGTAACTIPDLAHMLNLYGLGNARLTS